MRYRLFPLLASPLLLLAACNPEPNPGPRIDLVGSTTPALLSASRTSAVPADTFSTRVFAEARDTVNGPALTRLRITVEYFRNRNPYIYPSPYNPDQVPTEDDPLVFLDSLLPAGKRAQVFQYTAGTRSTSGQETWNFQVEDTEGASNQRSYVLTLRNPDSLLTYHRYTMRLQAPLTRKSRSYLALSAGLALPAFALGPRTAQNRDSIDVVYLPLAAGARALAAPADPALTLRAWTTRRRTEFRRTTLNQAGFTAADSQAELVDAFATGTPLTPTTNTGVLTKGQVVAFRTITNKTGLLYIEDFPTAPRPAVLLQVRITK
ncbi:hypothetical protein [Hymenobacter yonginensis]|uniref:DUF4270 family protein n=1 Tax=Hymenobacter yonginensis TaxID=748197 RepID=A0ABY7PNQ3_9BACT|nr:hypothetical protein [Hymenobacter yonginensis]WBO84262.1 hypothetical protein O9Z63_18055 [Hymenobacter yonginensis]